jgi:acyl transferase domain-containing protein/NAD(P)-dependent dehydrogenase (short-subunit alcohol dehydrogenase family)
MTIKKQIMEPLAVVGMSCLYPKAQSLQDYWANIKEKVDAITEIPDTHWDKDAYYNPDKKAPDQVYSKHGGFLGKVDFNPSEWGIAPSDIEAIDTTQLLSLVVAQGAMLDAGYGPKRDFNRDNVSVVLGITGALEMVVPLGARLGHPKWRKAMEDVGLDKDIIDEVVENIGDAYVSWQENSFPGLLGNVAAGRIANRLDLGGTNCVVDAACASALSAINLAAMELWTGKMDMAITGGVDTFNDIFMYTCFSKTPALSPSGHARPFSNDNDGTTLGEGVGMVVLKRLSDAEKDGDKIYAVLKAMGSSSDGKGKAIYAPAAEGQKKALSRAYEMAGVTPKDITLVEAHGTGTGAGDREEVLALNDLYGESKDGTPWCALGSVKSQIGHTKSAAGSASLIKAVLAVKNKIIPPTIKVTKPADSFTEKTPFYLPNQKRPWITENGKPRIAAVSALGFGGTNFHAVVEEYTPKKETYDWDRGIELFTISGKDKATIKATTSQIKALKDAAEIKKAAAESRSAFSHKDSCRLCFAVDTNNVDMANTIGSIEAQLDKSDNFSLPTGAYFNTSTETAPLGVVFPGQGAQYTNMGLDLACLSPEMFSVLCDADKEIGKAHESGRRLVDCIYPIPTYDAEKDAINAEILKATDVAQPSIGAVSLGQYKLLEKFGLKASAFTGHSYGELTSLCAAGSFDAATLAKLSRKRGELMAQGEGDRGGMIAVAADRAKVEEIIKEENINLVVANHNSPKQVVLSGDTAEVKRSKDIFKGKKIRATILKVAGAFHSSYVADAAEPFHKFLKSEKMEAPSIPVYANTTSEAYPKKVDQIKKLLGHQLANPVRFVEIINRMYEDGIKNFIEIGPGGKMINLVKAILEGKEFNAMALDSSAGKKNGTLDLAKTLAQLASLGYELDIKAWQDGEAYLEKLANTKKPRFTFPICGANYRNPQKPKAKKPRVAKPAKTVSASTTPAPKPAAAKPAPATKPAPARQVAPTAQPVMQPTSQVNQTMTQNNPTQPQVVYAPPANPVNINATGTLAALQQMQQQTADLHRRFLEGQIQAQATIQAIMTGQAVQPIANYAPAAPQPVAAPATTPIQPAYHMMPTAAPQQAPAPVTAPAPVAAPTPTPAPKPTPVVKAAPKAQPAVAAKPATPKTDVKPVLLDIVSEKTGYPKDMLDIEMDMEADLGIDSIKRVEIMSAVQEKLPNAPVIQPDQLGQLRTLAQILEYLAANAPASTAPAAAAPVPAASTTSIVPVILEVVSEKTGYPQDMLDLEMDMEADLGIDSIKRVEIMSAVQEKLPNAPVIQPDQLGQLRTLNQIIEHLSQGMPATAAAPQAAPAATGSASSVKPVLIEIVSEKTGYPSDMLDLEMDMEADLGIDSIKRVEIMSAVQEKLPNAPVIQPDQLGQLRTLAQILDFLGNSEAPAATTTAAPAQAAVSNITPTLIKIVSEKTGYPEDMLDLEMDMEADLGIDSIKRVEIMSAVQEQLPEAPVIQPDQLGQLRTLAQILDFLGANAVPAPAATPAPVADSNITPTLLKIVGEKTGYPQDMLDLEMDMEADLGIDSIKRVEIMSAVQEELPDAPVIQPDQLGQLRTLAQILDFLGANAAPAATTSAPTQAAGNSGQYQSVLVEVVAEKTGYPEDMLDLDMDMEADLGIDSIKRVEILSAFQEKMPDAPVVQPGDLGNFRTLSQILEYLNSNSASAAPAQATAPIADAPVAEKFPLIRTTISTEEFDSSEYSAVKLPEGSKVVVTDDGTDLSTSICSEIEAKGYKAEKAGIAQLLESEPSNDIAGVIILAAPPKRAAQNLWTEASEAFLKDAFFVAQKYGAVARKNRGIIATVSRMDGNFGLENPTKTIDPVQGGLAGITKTITHEWNEVVSRAFDLDYRFKDAEKAAKVFVDELFNNGPVETGITKATITRVVQTSKTLTENPGAPARFAKGEVIVVTGGARGVTAEVAITMAEKYNTTMILLGRSSEPEAEPAWLANLSQEAEIKAAILKNAGKKITPKELEAEYRSRMSNREILTNISKIEKAGGKAKYYSLDVRNIDQLNSILDEVRKDYGAIRGFIHGAGVLRDRKIEDKTRDQLDAVIDTKVIGLRNMLKALIQDELKAIILFSSFSGRFGRLGQVDYSMANEVLNKTAQKLRVLRPACRILSFNWGPWDGGMVTSSLRNVFLAEGIGLIPLKDGAMQPVIEFSHPEENDVEISIIGAIEGQESPFNNQTQKKEAQIAGKKF